MGSPNDSSERRSRRTSCLAEALRFQLDACREAEGLAAIVVSDQLGFCVAHSGADSEHAELAAQLPILRGPATELDGRSLVLTSFSAAGETLHACAVEPPRRRPTAGVHAALERVASGFSRMLGQ
jgi:hypothetical protein